MPINITSEPDKPVLTVTIDLRGFFQVSSHDDLPAMQLTLIDHSGAVETLFLHQSGAHAHALNVKSFFEYP
jgi:hypothetical protein